MRIRVLLLAVALVAASAGVDRVAGFAPRSPAGRLPTVPSGGVLACPVATTGSGEAFLYLMNTGSEIGRARVLIRPTDRTGGAQVRVVLRPGRGETVALHRLVNEPAGALVEWSGGQIVATHALKTVPRIIGPGRRLPRFAAAERCREPVGPELALTAGRTDSVGDTTLSLFNPSPAAADVSIAIRIDGQFVEPQRLQRRVVKPLSRRDFSLRDFAFGKGEIAVLIRSLSGRVVAEAFVETREGSELIAAEAPAAELIAMSPVAGPTGRLSFSGTDLDPVSVVARRYRDGESEAPEVPPTLGPGVLGQIRIPGVEGPVGYALSTSSAGRIVAATSWSVSSGIGFDVVAVPAGAPSLLWRGVAAGLSDGWATELLVAAAHGESSTVDLRVIGARGRRDTIDLAPGTVRRITLANDRRPHGFVLEASSPIVVVVIGRSGTGAAGYAFLAAPDRAESPTAPRPDNSVGVSRRT